jgi:hypothetical protein
VDQLPESSEPLATTVWVGLKNSDDQGTAFDLRAELYRNGALVNEGEIRCITGVTRNANLAKSVGVPFSSAGPSPSAQPGDVVSLKVLTRIGTNPDGTRCPGHANALGLRLYFDAADRPARFAAQINQGSVQDLFLHAAGATGVFDTVAPTAQTAASTDSASIKFAGGNAWKEVGTWTATQP